MFTDIECAAFYAIEISRQFLGLHAKILLAIGHCFCDKSLFLNQFAAEAVKIPIKRNIHEA